MNKIEYLDLKSIVPSKLNPRKTFDEENLVDLAASIQELGVLQPITVRPLQKKGKYEIVCGERRYRACEKVSIPQIPAIIRKLTDDEAMDVMITENLQREDVDPMEEAQAYEYLMTEKNNSVDDLAARFGKSKSYIYQRRGLTNLIPFFIELYKNGEVRLSHLIVISSLLPDRQEKLIKNYNGEDWPDLRNYSVKELKERIIRTNPLLSDAFFQTEICKSCKFNTGFNTIFPDQDASCLAPLCYRTKQKGAINEMLTRKKEENPDLIIFCSFDIDNMKKEYPMFDLEGHGPFLPKDKLDEETEKRMRDDGWVDCFDIKYKQWGLCKRNNTSGYVKEEDFFQKETQLKLFDSRTRESIEKSIKKDLESIGLASSTRYSVIDAEVSFRNELLKIPEWSQLYKDLKEKYGDLDKVDIHDIALEDRKAIRRYSMCEDLLSSYKYPYQEKLKWIKETYPSIRENVEKIEERREKSKKKLETEVEEMRKNKNS